MGDQIRNEPNAQWIIGTIVFAGFMIFFVTSILLAVGVDLQQTLTLVGLFLQIAGIGVTIKGLRDLREMFDVSGALESLKSLIARLAESFKERGAWGHTVASTGTRQARQGASADIAVSERETETDGTNEQRLEKLEEQMRELQATNKNMRQALSELSEKLDGLSDSFNKKVEKLKKAFTESIPLDAIGLSFLLVGTVMMLISVFV